MVLVKGRGYAIIPVLRSASKQTYRGISRWRCGWPLQFGNHFFKSVCGIGRVRTLRQIGYEVFELVERHCLLFIAKETFLTTNRKAIKSSTYPRIRLNVIPVSAEDTLFPKIPASWSHFSVFLRVILSPWNESSPNLPYLSYEALILCTISLSKLPQFILAIEQVFVL